jgi:hypothetical protein
MQDLVLLLTQEQAGATATIGHGLGADTPDVIFLKKRNGCNRLMYG